MARRDSGAVPGGALLSMDRDVDLGVAGLGGGGSVGPVVLDSPDSTVIPSTTEFAGQAGLTRGTDLSTRVPVAALGEDGLVSAMALAPEDTVVLIGGAWDGGTPSVVRSPEPTRRSGSRTSS